MAQKEEEKKVNENLLDIISANLKLRFGDVFFSYFIVFEIVYNWKFFYVLILKDEVKAKAVITYASEFLVAIAPFSTIKEFLNYPSPFTLALLSAFVMSLFYPVIQFGILKSRKAIFFYTNKNLEEDYPTREEYKSLKKEVEKINGLVTQIKQKRVGDISQISRVMLNQENFVERKTIVYSIVVGKEDRHFKEDELVQVTSSSNAIVERTFFHQIDKNNLYIIVQKITDEIFLVAKVGQEIPVTPKMFENGCDVFAVSKYGTPSYITSDRLNKELGYGKEFMLVAQLDKDKKVAHINWNI